MLLGKTSKDVSARVAALGANLSLTRKVKHCRSLGTPLWKTDLRG